MHSGSIEFLTNAGALVPNYYDIAKEVQHDSGHYAVSLKPSLNMIMNGSDTCIGEEFHSRFSLLFYFRVNTTKFSTTLLKVGKFSVTLEMCNSRVIVNFDKEDNMFEQRSLVLHGFVADKDQGLWNKLGISFSDDGIEFYVNCHDVQTINLPSSPVKCNEGTEIGILLPSEFDSCDQVETEMVIFINEIC